MAENEKKILEMLADKKITVDEAQRLLSLIGEVKGSEDGSPTTVKTGKSPKYLRVTVEPETEGGSERVNVRVPVALIRAGVRLTSFIPKHAVNRANEAMKEKGVDLDLNNIRTEDIEQLVDALNDLEVNVQDGKARIRVYTE